MRGGPCGITSLDESSLGSGESPRMQYVNLAPHNVSGPLGTMAGAHLCAAIPNFLALEWHAASVPFFDQLVKGADGPMIRNGRMRVPDAPGLGIELDLDIARKYAKRGEPSFGEPLFPLHNPVKTERARC